MKEEEFMKMAKLQKHNAFRVMINTNIMLFLITAFVAATLLCFYADFTWLGISLILAAVAYLSFALKDLKYFKEMNKELFPEVD